MASVILEDPEWATACTTAELARRADVSDPMVLRFSRSMGCSGFPELKLELARSLARPGTRLTGAVATGDSSQDYIAKRVAANVSVLHHLERELEAASVEEAVALMANASELLVFGMGGSAPIALDAHHKLFRLGTPTSCYSDNLMQRMAAAGASPDTTVLAISFTGRTSALLEAVQIARARGCSVVSISERDSPLAQLANVNLPSTAELEDTATYVPMTTRIAILTLIDILVTGLSLQLGPEVDERLQRIKNGLEGTR